MSTIPPEAMPRHVLERKLRSSRRLNIVLGFVAVVALALGLFQTFAGDKEAVAGAASQQVDDASGSGSGMQLDRRAVDDPRAIGDVDAPIVLSLWTDLRCPYCAVFSRDTMPSIVSEYVETGQVRVEVRDAAYFGEQSEAAAVAVRAAGEQGLYFEYMSAVYEAAPESGHAEFTNERLIEFAKQVGVADLAKFSSDLLSEELLAGVQADTAHAQELGVNAVPFFAVGDQAMSGAQPIDNFRSFLDAQLELVQ